MHEENSFLTLTYAPDHLPSDGSVSVRDFQLFMKRLRKRLGIKVRFFACGEYGEKLGRPHYHACLFGYDFPDKELDEVNHRGDKIYRSRILEETWQKGRCSVGDLTFESAAYVARYVTKKITGPAAADHYQGKTPEFTLHSKKPGIGQGFYQRWRSDIYPHDEVILRGQKMRPPKYYDGQLEKDDPAEFQRLKQSRKTPLIDMITGDNDAFRRAARERVQQARMKRLNRRTENDVS